MIHRKRLILIAVVTLLSYFSLASAQKISVAVTPALIDAKVSRGTSYTQKFTLSNDTGTRLRFKCSVADVWFDESNNRVSGRAGTLQRSASLWVQFSADEIVVEPHTSGTVTALVTVPNTAAGSYYSVPVFEAMPADPALADPTVTKVSTGSATIGVRFNGLMMFTTLNAAEYSIEIMGGQITSPSATAELALQLDLRNRGNAHAFVRGALAILDSSGTLAARGVIEEKRYLPEQRRMLETGWAGTLPPGEYTAVITLSYDRVGVEPATLLYELPMTVK